MNRKVLAWALASLVLAACGGGGSDDGGQNAGSGGSVGGKSECANHFAVAGSRLTSLCAAGCTDENLRAANDGQRRSYAALKISQTDAGTSALPLSSIAASVAQLTVTAPAGVSFPAGEKVGAIVQLASSDMPLVQTVLVSTLLGGVVQETFNGGVTTSTGQPSEDRLYAFPSSKAYDAVQFSLELSRPVSLEGNPIVKVYEFCG